MITIDGDIHELRLLVKGLEDLAGPETRHEIAQMLVGTVRELLDEEFAGAKDPYGKPWAPLTSRAGTPLNNTGGLRDQWAIAAVGDDVRFASMKPFAATHQYGATIKPVRAKALAFRAGGLRPNSPAKPTGDLAFAKEVTIPQRQMAPEGDLGDVWNKALSADVDDYLVEHFGQH